MAEAVGLRQWIPEVHVDDGAPLPQRPQRFQSVAREAPLSERVVHPSVLLTQHQAELAAQDDERVPLARAVLAVRSDSVAAQQLRVVEGELRATLAAISCAFLLPALSARLPALIACCCRLARQQLDRVKRKRGR